jgi:hypothetical protein
MRPPWHDVLDNSSIEFKFRTLRVDRADILPSPTTRRARCRSVAQPRSSHDGQIIAVIHVTGVFAWDKPKHVEKFYGTRAIDHPGGT